MTDTSPAPPGDFHFSQMLPMLVFDVALPIVVFNVLSQLGVPLLWALVAGGVSPALNNLRAWITTRRLEPVGIIVMSFLAVGAAGSLLSGSVFFALIKDSFLTGTFGAICLASLFAKRPLLFYIIGQFVAGDDPARVAWWYGLWDEQAGFRRVVRRVTSVWGIAYLIEAGLRVVFALTLAPGEVVLISPIMGFGALVLLIAWSRRYMMAHRDRQLKAPGS